MNKDSVLNLKRAERDSIASLYDSAGAKCRGPC